MTRSDCTQLEADIEFTIYEDNNNQLKARAQYSENVNFASCTGHKFGNPNQQQNNDLASHVNKLVAQGHVSSVTQAAIFSKLVGYTEPNNNEFQEACDLALANEELDMILLKEITSGRGGSGSKRRRIGLKVFVTLTVVGLVGVSMFVISHRRQFHDWTEDIARKIQGK